MKIDDEYRFREERAEDLRQRDREREPRARFRSARRGLAGRDAFRVTLADRGAAVRDDGRVVATERAPHTAIRRSTANRSRGNHAAWDRAESTEVPDVEGTAPTVTAGQGGDHG